MFIMIIIGNTNFLDSVSVLSWEWGAYMHLSTRVILSTQMWGHNMIFRLIFPSTTKIILIECGKLIVSKSVGVLIPSDNIMRIVS